MKLSHILALLILFSGCNAPPASHITIQNPRVRQNIPPQQITAAYMAIHNTGPATALTGASTSAADITELHVMTHDGAMMRMKKIDRLPIPANGSATLQPGGNHLMLIGLKKALTPGDSLDLTLTFENGQTKTFYAPIVSVKREK